MNSSNIYHINTFKQDCQEGKVTMQGLAITNLLHNLIREYGHIKNNSYVVDVNHFDLADKRLMLSYLESASWYEYACESAINTEALFSEHEKYIQNLIDDECRDLFHEDMEEMRECR